MTIISLIALALAAAPAAEVKMGFVGYDAGGTVLFVVDDRGQLARTPLDVGPDAFVTLDGFSADGEELFLRVRGRSSRSVMCSRVRAGAAAADVVDCAVADEAPLHGESDGRRRWLSRAGDFLERDIAKKKTAVLKKATSDGHYGDYIDEVRASPLGRFVALMHSNGAAWVTVFDADQRKEACCRARDGLGGGKWSAAGAHLTIGGDEGRAVFFDALLREEIPLDASQFPDKDVRGILWRDEDLLVVDVAGGGARLVSAEPDAGARTVIADLPDPDAMILDDTSAGTWLVVHARTDIPGANRLHIAPAKPPGGVGGSELWLVKGRARPRVVMKEVKSLGAWTTFDPTRAELRVAYARAHELNLAGHELYKQGKLADALTPFAQAVAAFPRHPVPLFNLACVKARLGDAAGAAQALDRYRLLNPGWRKKVLADADLIPILSSPPMQELLARGAKTGGAGATSSGAKAPAKSP